MAQNILISLLVNPGDVIMMTSAIELMRRQLPPDTRLGLMLRPSTVEIVEGNPLFDEVISYPYRSGSLFFALGDLRKKIKASGYDLFLSLDRRPRGAMAAFLSGIKNRIGPDILFAGAQRKLWTSFLFTKTIKMSPAECSGSLVEMFQLVARRAFNIQGKGRISLPPVSAQKATRAAELLPRAKGPIIGLCVKTNDPGKTWPQAGFASLIKKLSCLSVGLYITGGPADAEYIDELLKMSGGAAAVNLAGKTSLMDIPALAAHSDLFISLDNAAAHLAANSGLEKIICLLLATTYHILIDSMPKAKFIHLARNEERGQEEQLKAEIESVFKAAVELLKISPGS